MILNVSGRCDILAFYSEWFMKRYKEGFVDVKNPFVSNQIQRVLFSDVDLIVFCTKNPLPFLKYIDEIKHPYIFQITLTPYHRDIEPNMPQKQLIIEGIKRISSIMPKDYFFLRYDPIFFNERYDLNYHIKAFERICTLLEGYIEHIIISFLDDCKNVRNHYEELKLCKDPFRSYHELASNFVKIAKLHGMSVQSCFEGIEYVVDGILNVPCITEELAFKLTGKKGYGKWQARSCGCVKMVDIGAYNCCDHRCLYCYANFDESRIEHNMTQHDENSSLLIGHLKDHDIIKKRYR